MSVPGLDLARRIAEEHAAAAERLPAGVVDRAHRRRAIDALVSGGLPTSRDENWRYAGLRPLERVRFAPAATGVALAADVAPAAETLPPVVAGYVRYVFIDGVLAAPASGPAAPSAGVRVRASSRGGLQAAGEFASWESATGSAAGPSVTSGIERGRDGAFALINDAFALDCAHVEVSKDTGAGEPVCIEVVFAASAPAQQGASYPRLRIDAAPGSRLRLIERHVSLAAEASFVDGAVEVRIGEGARLDHFRIQQLDARAIFMDTLRATVERSAVYRLHGISLGAQAARSTLGVRLEGESAELALHAVAVADDRQILDSYALVEHAAAHTRTEESFRGIAAGRARIGFNGKIVVHPGAQGAYSSQSLRGLLAGAEADVNVRPQLEIYTDDVRCTHGATAGKLDDMMLFYLLSRGLDRAKAQQLLEWAFLEDVVAKIDVPELRRHIEQSLAGRLRESEALKELL
ncbi:MAG: Fe-S cluster assembly protein SufD [Steroidobacteraceae bacterium]